MEAKKEKEMIRVCLVRDGGCPLTDKQMESAVDALWEYLASKINASRPVDSLCKGLEVYRNVLEYEECRVWDKWAAPCTMRNVTMHDIAATYRVVRFDGGFVILQPNPELGVQPGLEDSTKKWYADPTDAADAGMLMISTLIEKLKVALDKHGDMPVAVPCAYEENYSMTDAACHEHTMYDPKEYDSVEEFIEDVGSELAMFNGKPYIGPFFSIGEL